MGVDQVCLGCWSASRRAVSTRVFGGVISRAEDTVVRFDVGEHRVEGRLRVAGTDTVVLVGDLAEDEPLLAWHAGQSLVSIRAMAPGSALAASGHTAVRSGTRRRGGGAGVSGRA